MRFRYAACLLLVTAAQALGAPPKPPAVVKLRVGEITSVEVAADPGKEIAWAPGFTPEACYVDEGKPFRKDTARLIVSPKVAGVYRVVLWSVGEREYSTLVIDAGGAPVPPEPVPPKPPEPVPPVPVTSFRVIVIYESADNLTLGQRGVVFGKAVEDWLNANCTGGKAGWRRRDRDAPGENDPTMAALWSAVKPAVTVTPCIAVERNGKVEIINLEATPAKMVEVLKRYQEGK